MFTLFPADSAVLLQSCWGGSWEWCASGQTFVAVLCNVSAEPRTQNWMSLKSIKWMSRKISNISEMSNYKQIWSNPWYFVSFLRINKISTKSNGNKWHLMPAHMYNFISRHSFHISKTNGIQYPAIRQKVNPKSSVSDLGPWPLITWLLMQSRRWISFMFPKTKLTLMRQ